MPHAAIAWSWRRNSAAISIQAIRMAVAPAASPSSRHVRIPYALEDLVRMGKVRYLGVSDTPAWKIAEANMISRFRGWSSFIGLQIEYSLLERTVEQELVPMASEFGLGITPWSPLKSGVLSGKYTRRNDGQHNADRGALVDSFLNEQAYAVIDELEIIAKAHETTIASVALAWVHAQAGVSSVIIGARRLSQLEDNV